MSTTLHSFMDIFDTTFGTGQEAVQLKKIIIPIIQRDYAQGRQAAEVKRVRERFLDSLYKAVTEKPVTLDFVYGDIDAEGNMTPLDGQQRLTTLFLLHWYAAKKAQLPEGEYEFLSRFSYETRYSARYFCSDLVKFNPEFEDRLSEEIINQAWFPLDWANDPTIRAMLVMIDAIDEKFKTVTNLWEKLKEKSITFYFLPIKDMGLTDELYIKMNSRGKPLTQFEHFKAELERELRSIDEDSADRIMGKIDREWTDLLWRYRSSGVGTADDNIVDDEFLRYFKFICDIICYKQSESPVGRSNDEFDLLKWYFDSKSPAAVENVKILEEFFDCWCSIPGFDSPSAFLESFMTKQGHEEGKILVDSRYNRDIFEDCLHAYSDKTGRTRQFPLNRIVLLYAIITYLRNNKAVTEEEFRRRIRIVNNLLQNSEDEVSDRIDRNRMPAILAETEAIVLTGKIDDTIDNNFNVNQILEEKNKITHLEKFPEQSENLFRLEDHFLLHGQVGIVGLEHIDYVGRFESLFKCSFDLVDCAMMALGDYWQRERNRWRYQFGSTTQYAWNQLFHKSANSGFDKTKSVLLSLLEKHQEFTNDILKKIADDFLQECENKQTYSFNYYYIKYKEYRPGSFGKMWNGTDTVTPSQFMVMQTKTQLSENSYIPFLKIADNAHLSRDDMGRRLVYGDEYITCIKDAYQRRDNTGALVETIPVPHNADGIDTEDRVQILQKYVKAHLP